MDSKWIQAARAALLAVALQGFCGCSKWPSETALGDRSYRRGALERAALHYDRALEADPRDAAAWRGRGNVHAENGESDRALDCYRRAQELAPQEPMGYFLEGILLGERGETDAAIEAYGKAIACPGGSPWARINRGQLLLEKGDCAASLADYDAVIGTGGDSGGVRMMRGRALSCLERWNEAESELGKAIALHAPAGAWSDRAFVRVKLGKWEEARSDAMKALAADKTVANLNNLALLLLASPREDLRDTERARELLAEARSLDPDNRYAPWLAGTEAGLAFADGDTDRAIALLQGLVDAGTAEPDDLKQLDAYRRGVPYYLGGE